MVSASSSSGSRLNAPRKYDVFVSFRGETRNNFTSHLHAALNREFVLSFRDDKQIEKGDEIMPSLIHAIKDSSVSIIVFSKDYASSRWCLDELAQIMRCRKDEGQFVLPIFYKVDPSHIRKQTGAYERAFEQHEKDFMHDPERVNRWKVALSEAGSLSGRHCQDFTDESNLIQGIVTDVSTKLEQIHNCRQTLKDVIGRDEMIKPIEELLGKSHRVGIWGMGGVGKTTMANVVFAKLSSQYDTCCFLENIREKAEKSGLGSVCSYLVSELLGQDMPSNPSNGLRNAFVARRLGKKKALVVLDDVDHSDQLEGLQDNICNFLGEGSKVITTTRNRKLLREKGYEIHEAKGLSYQNSRQLFIYKAFGSDHPGHGYEQLIEGFIRYTLYNPLALKVLGSYVHCEDKSLWDGLLRKLQGGVKVKDL
ncbi:TMV resistance protein N-like [Neltuma alba]|uniref:TMV resistance protein N-like n=1 Tax=Neltuma alba TaxID=207710 RepID=UPI0010A348FA|nr:TMV resistance protein N-like [Prosopis alba]